MKQFLTTFLFLVIICFDLFAAEPEKKNYFDVTIKVSGDPYYPPYEFINEHGKPDGFNIDLFYAVANELGLKFEIELLSSWSQALLALEAGQVDVLMGVMITPERSEKMRFTVPHSMITHSIFSRKESPVKTLDQLKGKEVIVQQSDRMHEYLKETGLTNRIVLTTSQRQALTFINNGNHDAALIATFQGLHFLRQLGLNNIEVHNTGIQPQPYAMAVAPDNDQLLALLNAGLYQVKASGQYDEIYKKWFSIYDNNYFFKENLPYIGAVIVFIIILIVFVILLRYKVYQTTKHLQESEARYRSIFQSKHTVMMLIDPATGNIIDANPAASDFYGWSIKQLTLMNISQINILSHKEIRKEMDRAKMAKERIFHFRHRISSGEVRDVEVHSGSIVLKRKELLFSIIHDVTEKVKAQKEIKSWQNLLQFIIMHAPTAIAVYDNSLRFVYVSDRFLKDYGIKQSDILGKTPFEIFPDIEKKWKSIYQRALDGEIINSEEDIMTRHDGTSESIRWQCRPWFDTEGQTGGVILYSEVITERKRSEELRYNLELARKTTQIKQTFLANISHEMRTPLNGIIGLGNYLAKSPLTPEQKNHLNIILDSSNTLLELINQVLNLSKIESGQMPASYEKIRIKNIVEKLLNTFSFRFEEKGIRFSVKVSEEFPSVFIYDEKQLMQVLTNLIGNALKFTKEGKVIVLFDYPVQKNGTREIIVSVKDTGLGIAPEYHDNIFMEFVQVHHSDDPYFSGTGLGLPISKRIVESFGGKMWVTSKPGEGSTFWFSIAPNKVNAPLQEQKTSEPYSRPLNLKVLLVEDKKVNRLVAELILEEMGCKIDIAENGKIAVEKVIHNKYDIILMDIQMPVMDGVKATLELKQMNIDLPPIIGLSAEAMEGDAERYISLGMDDYLTKPIDSELLYQIMVKHSYRKKT